MLIGGRSGMSIDVIARDIERVKELSVTEDWALEECEIELRAARYVLA